MKQLFIFFFLMQHLLCVAQSDSLVNKYLGFQKNVRRTSRPFLYNDKLVFFSNGNSATSKYILRMHTVDTCGDNFKTVNIEGVENVGIAKIISQKSKDGNILVCTDHYVKNDTSYPLVIKLNIEGKVLFKGKKPIFKERKILRPSAIEETADGYFIVGTRLMGSTDLFFPAGIIAKVGLDGTFLWDDWFINIGATPMSITPLSDGTFQVFGVQGFKPEASNANCVWTIYDKNGKVFKEQYPPANILDTLLYDDIRKIGNITVVTGYSYWDTKIPGYAMAAVNIMDDSLRIIKKYLFVPDTTKKLDHYMAYDITPTTDGGFLVTMLNYTLNSQIQANWVTEIAKFDANGNFKWKHKNSDATYYNVAYSDTDKVYGVLEEYIRADDEIEWNLKLSLTKLNQNGEAAQNCKLTEANEFILEKDDNFLLFPNPSTEGFTINTNDNGKERKKELRIFNALGELLLEQKSVLLPFFYRNTMDLTTGTYHIQLIDVETKAITMLKWIKI
jgi:hypothetical protein